MGKFFSIIFNPFNRLFSYLTNTILLPEIVTYPQFMEFAQVKFQHSPANQNEGLNLTGFV